ncbi:TetR/AcrR family transcriptional regulator [Agromyces larvae]|uniref:TetR/AcrR family transcriptional regulator n=1 Tax=Agromyces larvae TaxID=2929802 RepID=A0ABY4BW80_9MICO|nr:TetR/AcrR family transcriptional regulator [Agromyces larvae]UOE43476.1 TetR/AcrR family transcriptional regulator [Agromyces larvae]
MSSNAEAPPGRKPNLGPKAGPENRRKLIDAAREVFRDGGFAAPLSAVAKAAGVGQGSLYRHFPDRLALAFAVFDENLDELADLAEHPDASLDDLFDALSTQALGSTAIVEMIAAAPDDPRAAHLGEKLDRLVGLLRDRDVAAGRIGAHVETADVTLAIGMLGLAVARSPEGSQADASTRARAIFRTAFAPRDEPVRPAGSSATMGTP